MFAAQHDSSVKRCLEQLPHTTIPDHMARGHIAVGFGWVGFAERFERPAGVFLVQWGPCVAFGPPTSPGSGGNRVGGFHKQDPRHSQIQGAVVARSRLQDMGFRPPEWHALANGERPLGSPILVMSVLDSAVGQPRTPMVFSYSSVATSLGQIARVAQIPRRSHGENPAEVLPEFVTRRREISRVFRNLDVWKGDSSEQSTRQELRCASALDEVIAGWAHRDVTQEKRGFPKKKLEDRFQAFFAGKWELRFHCVKRSRDGTHREKKTARCRRQRCQGGEVSHDGRAVSRTSSIGIRRIGPW